MLNLVLSQTLLTNISVMCFILPLPTTSRSDVGLTITLLALSCQHSTSGFIAQGGCLVLSSSTLTSTVAHLHSHSGSLGLPGMAAAVRVESEKLKMGDRVNGPFKIMYLEIISKLQSYNRKELHLYPLSGFTHFFMILFHLLSCQM